jgi:hypothetical protein
MKMTRRLAERLAFLSVGDHWPGKYHDQLWCENPRWQWHLFEGVEMHGTESFMDSGSLEASLLLTEAARWKVNGLKP